MTITATSNNC